MVKNCKIESREETVARFREQFIEEYSMRAFNFEEALAEFDKNPEEFSMEFYTMADAVIDKLKDHPHVEYIRKEVFWNGNHNCDEWGWFCKPGHYPSITF